ncbi:MAG: hypothetical protein JXA97_10535 [Anaerolineales bacterium]|nr:hypothetical protein [Anaerolineales bacterium]
MRQTALGLLIFLVLFLPACTTNTPTNTTQPTCGDDVCAGPENAESCPLDCPTLPGQNPALTRNAPTPDSAQPDSPPPANPTTEGETVILANPASGADLNVEILLSGERDAATVVIVPGGTGCGGNFLDAGAMSANVLLDAGINVVLFDPDGRCLSAGGEDQDGFIHQDGLAAVIRYAAGHPGIDPSRLGIVSISFGITMAAGALARHPDLPVEFLIDYEGPATRDDTGGCDAALTGHLRDQVACDDEVFWREREALTFMPAVRVPYQRIQTETDHAQPDNRHALQMVTAAVNGASPWVRLNDLPANQAYRLDETVPYLGDSQDGRVFQLVIAYLPVILAAP